MSDPLPLIVERFEKAIVAAFGDAHADTDPLVGPSKNPQFGDYQANVAMSLAKKLGQKPRDVAAAIVQAIDLADLCEPPDIAGPGFINLRLLDSTVNDAAMQLAGDDRLGVGAVAKPQTVVVDSCGANIAKQMHVGHLRSLVIGDTFVRVLELLGHNVIRQNHVGDWGLQMGMVTHALNESGLSLDDLTLDQLESLYRQINAAKSEDKALAGRLIEETRKLQNTPKEQLDAWRTARRLTLAAVHDAFEELGVRLTPDDVRGESDYADQYAAMVDELLKDGHAQETGGAIGIFPPGFTNRDDEPMPFRIVSRDGTYQYATFDLAAVRFRCQKLNADRVVYTHDSRQAEHFAMMFASARLVGFVPEHVQLDFAPFGNVQGEDKKPLKTRSGENVKLADLFAEARQRAAAVVAEKNPDLSDDEREQVARVVGIGAIKYADLSSDRVKDYVFSWDRMLAMEGNTAPYLQYVYARICSIFRKADAESAASDWKQAAIEANQPAERALVLKLLQFGSTVERVGRLLEPHHLCNYLFDLATAFSSFYENCPVLKAEDTTTRNSRLRLCDLTARVMQRGLGLLGIEVLERM